mgnify:CR=1 FL=1
MQPILEEANESIRMAMYNLMAATKCPNAECLHETIKVRLPASLPPCRCWSLVVNWVAPWLGLWVCVCVVLTKRLFVCRVVQSLLQNMNRYPEDRLSIYQCLQGLGEHHG